MNSIKIIVITLKSAINRQESATKQLNDQPYEWCFLDAVDGRLIEGEIEEYPRKKVRRLLGFDLSPSELGCFMSHKKAWEVASKESVPVLILEDDFLLNETFEKAIKFALENLPHWDLLRLQALEDSKSKLIIKGDQFSIVKNDSDPLGSTAYLVKPRTAINLLKAARVIYEPLDHFIEHTAKHNRIIHALTPYPVVNSGVETTITDRPNSSRNVRGLKKFKRSFFRLLDRKLSIDPWFKK